MTDNPVLETADKFYNTTTEPEPDAPTEKVEVSKADDQDPPQQELDAPEEVSEESKATDEEETTQYLELDGKEYSLDEVREGINSHFMQKDYTKKTTALSEERKAFESERTTERDELLKLRTETSEMRDQLAVLVSEDDEINWAELKEDEPERYIELKERADKRREALEKIKLDSQTPVDDPAAIQEEQAKLYAANPDWLDDEGKTTDTFKADTKLINDFALKVGFTAEEFKQLRSHHITTILKAAKYEELQGKSNEIKAAREKVPLVTKPKANKSSGRADSMADRFYGKAAS